MYEDVFVSCVVYCVAVQCEVIGSDEILVEGPVYRQGFPRNCPPQQRGLAVGWTGRNSNIVIAVLKLHGSNLVLPGV